MLEINRRSLFYSKFANLCIKLFPDINMNTKLSLRLSVMGKKRSLGLCGGCREHSRRKRLPACGQAAMVETPYSLSASSLSVACSHCASSCRALDLQHAVYKGDAVGGKGAAP